MEQQSMGWRLGCWVRKTRGALVILGIALTVLHQTRPVSELDFQQAYWPNTLLRDARLATDLKDYQFFTLGKAWNTAHAWEIDPALRKPDFYNPDNTLYAIDPPRLIAVGLLGKFIRVQ